jgi:hypothetical protein
MLHEITKSGYAIRGQPNTIFGNVGELLPDLERWSRGKTLEQTNLSGPREDGDGAYLLDARHSGDRYLLTLWNPVPATDGQVASVRRTSDVGAAHVVMNEIAVGTIPGFATYFYFMPAARRVACVRFQHKQYGTGNMRSYLRSFLRYGGRHVVFDDEAEEGADIQIAGYAENGVPPVRKLKPLFDTVPCARDGDVRLLLQHADRITKVLRKTELNLAVREESVLWQKLLEAVHLRPAGRPLEPVRLQFSMDGSLNADQVRAVVADWEAGRFGEEDWEDVGFVLAGESGKPHWLSHSLARTALQLDVRRDSIEVVNPGSLLRQLVLNEADILRRLV